MDEWLNQIFANQELLKMGHWQRQEDFNLGFGWLYYSLSRIVRTKIVVVIGSYRGFSPLMFGKGLMDNQEGGKVIFIDPSYVDNFWHNPQTVEAYFNSYGVNNIEHFLMTTQDFILTETYQNLRDIGLVFIDGYHTKAQAQFDYSAFVNLLSPEGIILFHDSISFLESKIYGKDKIYTHTVKYFIDELKQDPLLQVFDFPFAQGVTLVRKIAN